MTIGLILVTIMAVIVLVIVSGKLAEQIYNFKSQDKPNSTNQKQSIVYNKKKRRLEADQSVILPF